LTDCPPILKASGREPEEERGMATSAFVIEMIDLRRGDSLVAAVKKSKRGRRTVMCVREAQYAMRFATEQEARDMARRIEQVIDIHDAELHITTVCG